MPIEFSCPQCNQVLRTPDGSEGLKSKCPKCQSVVVIPSAAGGLPPVPTGPPPQPQNPYGDLPAPGGPINPYSSPLSQPFSQQPAGFGPSNYDVARSKLMGPAIGLMIGSAVALLVHVGYAIWILVVGIEDEAFGGPAQNEAETIGRLIGAGCITIVPFVFNIMIMFGAVSMLRLRGYWMAMTAAILGVLPCSYCCWIGLPFGIWGLIVLNDDTVKSAFR